MESGEERIRVAVDSARINKIIRTGAAISVRAEHFAGKLPRAKNFYLLLRSSLATTPSRMWTTRWACSAISFSWVTSTMVLPLLVEVFHQLHDFVAGLGIEVAGGLVGQDD